MELDDLSCMKADCHRKNEEYYDSKIPEVESIIFSEPSKLAYSMNPYHNKEELGIGPTYH